MAPRRRPPPRVCLLIFFFTSFFLINTTKKYIYFYYVYLRNISNGDVKRMDEICDKCIRVTPSNFKRIVSLKEHPRETHNDVISKLLKLADD